MKCPYCGYEDSRVLDSRPTEEGGAIRRRRECTACLRRFTTYERVEEIPLIVIKKDGRREPFDRNKILSGLLKACEKRPVSLERLERLVNDVEREMRNSLKGEVESREIGEMAMNRLKEVDEIAYVRFASVYRQFKDVGKFLEELEVLLQDREKR
ncbi:MAG: transcriptional regulator NrdR [Bacillota bacterium]|nr:transcriptional regulator NrdR [Bacillota bacterium]